MAPPKRRSPSAPFDDPLAGARDRAMQALSLHFAHDRLSTDELDRRLERAALATSAAELEALLADLPGAPAPVPHAPPLPGGAPGPAVATHPDAVPPRGVIVAVMGGATRKGSWTVPRALRIWAVMGGAELDLRRAIFAPGITEIDVGVVMGGVEIVIPPGIRVETAVSAFMGGVEVAYGDTPPDPASEMVLWVSGFALMGGVEVKVKRLDDRDDDDDDDD